MSTQNLDLSNGRFDNLTVKSYVGERPHNNVAKVGHWKCECTCGKAVIIPSSDLISGNAKSCGCNNSVNSLLH